MAATYTFNPACHCKWCRNDGQTPADDGSAGHSWAYEEPHNPPSTIRFIGTPAANQQVTA